MGELMVQEVDEVSISPWAAHVIFVPKKDVALRFCINFCYGIRRLTPKVDFIKYHLQQKMIDQRLDIMPTRICNSILERHSE
ncbi:uncharacterized protein VTP21DRAFT_8118 [Calcarisporiella thermophila]|uniref:uncharacterized protein n=1 Tax=Calcarisporiella thermophila TaxID=911321 RepID=UPI0037443611